MEATKSSRPGIPTERIILGIDPGTTVMGFGVLLVQNGKATLIEADAIRFSAGDDHTLRLREIFNHVLRIIEKHHPDELAIEAQFFGQKRAEHAEAGTRAGRWPLPRPCTAKLAVVEYAPKRIKQSITGNGNATKEQVAAMLGSILGNAKIPKSTDATDAIAVALCHHFAQGSVARPTKFRW
jgi:crossover junction endodeoxyribonuclease RuvC